MPNTWCWMEDRCSSDDSKQCMIDWIYPNAFCFLCSKALIVPYLCFTKTLIILL